MFVVAWSGSGIEVKVTQIARRVITLTGRSIPHAAITTVCVFKTARMLDNVGVLSKNYYMSFRMRLGEPTTKTVL